MVLDMCMSLNMEAEARYERNRSVWDAKYVVNPDVQDSMPWAQTKKVNGVWVVGCHPCAAARLTSPWAAYSICTPIRTQHMTKHANSKQHVAACRRYIAALGGIGISSVGQLGLVGSPPVQDFIDLVKNLVSPETSKDIGVSHKRRALAWCLAEAKMDMERSALRAARSICLGQDAQQGCLLMHVSASTAKFEQLKFFLGYQPLSGTDAYSTITTSASIIDRFCTPRADPPGYGIMARHPSPGKLNETLKNDINNAVETLCTDAASDELRVGRLMSGRAKSECVEVMFQNFLNHVKDPTHASGRFLKTWSADPFISATFNLFISHPGSITNLIQHSPHIQSVFKKHLRALGLGEDGILTGHACAECFHIVASNIVCEILHRPCSMSRMAAARHPHHTYAIE